MIEIKVDGYTLFEMATLKDVAYQAAQYAEIHQQHLDMLATLRDERDALKAHNTMLRACIRGIIKVADRKTDEFDAAKAALEKS